MLATHFSLDNLQEKIKVSIHREYISIFMLYFYELNQFLMIFLSRHQKYDQL